MKISELFMNIAKENFIDHFFGIPGSGVPLDLMDSGRKIDLHFVNVAHESTAAIAAGTYGLLKDSSGLSLAVKGVGAANLTGGIANAYFERMPVVGVCETTPNYSYENEMVQHADHYGMMKSVTKKMLTISNDLFVVNNNSSPGSIITNRVVEPVVLYSATIASSSNSIAKSLPCDNVISTPPI